MSVVGRKMSSPKEGKGLRRNSHKLDKKDIRK